MKQKEPVSLQILGSIIEQADVWPATNRQWSKGSRIWDLAIYLDGFQG